MKNTNKILALILCATLLLGILAGCGNNASSGDPESKPGTNSGDKYDVPEICGTIMLNANACVDISFDKDGKVLNIQEVDHDGSQLLSDYAGYLQLPCVEVVKELVAISFQLELLTSEFNDILIKQYHDSKLPSETFLEELAEVAKEASEISVSVTVLTEEDVDAEGNILPKAAYDVLQNALQVDKFDLIESDEVLAEGVYTFNVIAGTLEGVYLVEANTGYVYEGMIDYVDPEQDTEDWEDEFFVPTVETTEPAQADSQPEDTEVPEE